MQTGLPFGQLSDSERPVPLQSRALQVTHASHPFRRKSIYGLRTVATEPR